MLGDWIHRVFRLPYLLFSKRYKATGKKRGTVLLIHGIGSSHEMWRDIIPKLINSYDIIAIDLLGFGRSPHPSYTTYSAKTHARSVLATILSRYRPTSPIIVVGHSLGSLVAIEFARRYPALVRRLILCSPPLYKITANTTVTTPDAERLLKSLYRVIRRHPEQLPLISDLGKRLGLVDVSVSITKENAGAFVETLETTIINQTSINDVILLPHHITILYGYLDPLVLLSNLRYVEQSAPRTIVKKIHAGHDIHGRYSKELIDVILDNTEP